jgi:hypothetical protein
MYRLWINPFPRHGCKIPSYCRRSSVLSPTGCLIRRMDMRTHGINATWSARKTRPSSSNKLFELLVVVHVDGVRLCLWTAATNRPVVHSRDDIWVWTAMVEWYLDRTKPNNSEKKPVAVPFCPGPSRERRAVKRLSHGTARSWRWPDKIETRWACVNKSYRC